MKNWWEKIRKILKDNIPVVDDDVQIQQSWQKKTEVTGGKEPWKGPDSQEEEEAKGPSWSIARIEDHFADMYMLLKTLPAQNPSPGSEQDM